MPSTSCGNARSEPLLDLAPGPVVLLAPAAQRAAPPAVNRRRASARRRSGPSPARAPRRPRRCPAAIAIERAGKLRRPSNRLRLIGGKAVAQGLQGVFEVALSGDRVDDGNHKRIISRHCGRGHSCIMRVETGTPPSFYNADSSRCAPACNTPTCCSTLTTLFWSGNMVSVAPSATRCRRCRSPSGAGRSLWRWFCRSRCRICGAQWPLLRAAGSRSSCSACSASAATTRWLTSPCNYTAATNAVLLNSFIPIATIALSWAFLKKHLHGIEWLGVLISLAGVTIIVCRGEVADAGQSELNVGDLWMLVAVFTWALYTIGLQWRPAGVDPMLLLAAFIVVGLIALAPAYAWEISQGQDDPRLARRAGRNRLYRNASRLSRLRLLQPRRRRSRRQQGQPVHPPDAGLRHLLSAIFLAEMPRSYHYLGIALIFAGIYLTTAAPGKT
jgi:drug/metabolite transporter (DMT)-like permease